MTYIQNSLIKKTSYEGLALAAMAVCAGCAIYAKVLPGLSKKGLVLTGGAFFSSSFLYNYFRDEPDRFFRTACEKALIFGGISLLASRSIAPCAALSAGAATLIFSTIVTKKTALSPLEKEHFYYTKNPREWFALGDEVRTKLFNTYFEKDLPPIPGFCTYDKNTFVLSAEKKDDMMQSPANYTDHQLGWLLASGDTITFNEKNSNFLAAVIERKIPLYDFEWRPDENQAQQPEALSILFKESPIYYYYTQDNVTKDASIPQLEDLVKELSVSAIQKMPLHLVNAWYNVFCKELTPWTQPLDQQAAFYIRFAALDFYSKLEKKALKQEMQKNPKSYSKEALEWYLLDSHNDTLVKITDEELPLFEEAMRKGVILPPLTHQDRKSLATIYAKYPLYYYLENNQLEVQGDTDPNLPSFETCTKWLTRAAIDKMSPQTVKAWHHALNKKETRWNLVSTRAQIALLKRFDAFGLDTKERNFSTKKIKADLPLTSNNFTKEDYAYILSREDLIDLDICKLSDLGVLKKASDLGVNLPRFQLVLEMSEAIFKGSPNEKISLALFTKYPFNLFIQTENAIKERMQDIASSLPTFETFAKKLTFDAIAAMPNREIKLWHQALDQKDHWNSLPPDVMVAFKERFIKLNLHCFDFIRGITDAELGCQKLGRVSLKDEDIYRLNYDQVLWYRSLFLQERPILADDSDNTYPESKELSALLDKCAPAKKQWLMPLHFFETDAFTRAVSEPRIRTLFIDQIKFYYSDQANIYSATELKKNLANHLSQTAHLLTAEELGKLTSEEETQLRAFSNQFPFTNRYVEDALKDEGKKATLIQSFQNQAKRPLPTPRGVSPSPASTLK